MSQAAVDGFQCLVLEKEHADAERADVFDAGKVEHDTVGAGAHGIVDDAAEVLSPIGIDPAGDAEFEPFGVRDAG